MTVASDTNRSGPYAGAGTAGPFAVGFPFLDDSHLLVVQTDALGAESTLILGTDYSVVGAGSSIGGTLTLTSVLAVGLSLTIQRNVPVTQLLDYTQSDSFPAESHEQGLDKLTMIAQQNRTSIVGALRVPETASTLPTFPIASARALKFMVFDASGNPAVVSSLPSGSFTSGNAYVDQFTGTGAQTAFTLSQNPGTEANLGVTLAGVTQRNGVDFTWLSGTTLTFVTAPALGVGVQARYTNAINVDSAATLRADLLSTASVSAGAALVGFDPTLNYTARTIGAVLRDGMPNAMAFIPTEAERAAIKAYTSTTDRTAVINAALAYSKRIYLPAGLWNVDTDTGIVVSTGGSIVGDGLMKTVIKAAGKGGSLAELVAYAKGSVIKRAFTLGVANPYVFGCYLADFSIILNHPAYNAANYKQIGIDLRHISRSTVERVYIGNEAPTATGFPLVAAPSATDRCQGYGIVLGTVSSGDVAYCGGELNAVRDSHVWGVFKNIDIDDTTLTPLSSAHGTLIDNCDVQHGHEMISQASATNAGTVIQNVTIQSNDRQSGNANPTIGLVMTGYNGRAHVKYAEMGPACDVTFSFASGSKNSEGLLGYYSYTAPSTGSVTDLGTKNHLSYMAAVAGISSGSLVELFNKAPLFCTYKGSWSGAVQTVNQANGMTLTRTGTGDYTIVLATAQPNVHWTASISCDFDASNHGGLVAVELGTQSTTLLRFRTFSQDAGTTTQVDPRVMLITVRQAV